MWFNRGKSALLGGYFRGNTGDLPSSSFKLALVTDSGSLDPDDDNLSSLTQLANGNGYTTGGATVLRSSSGFDAVTESDSTNTAYIELADVTWAITGSGVSGIYHAVLTLDDGTLICSWSLSGPISQVAGQDLTLQDLRITGA